MNKITKKSINNRVLFPSMMRCKSRLPLFPFFFFSSKNRSTVSSRFSPRMKEIPSKSLAFHILDQRTTFDPFRQIFKAITRHGVCKSGQRLLCCFPKVISTDYQVTLGRRLCRFEKLKINRPTFPTLKSLKLLP